VNFLQQSNAGGWKLRRVILESNVISYTDKYSKKKHLLELVPFSVVDEPSASTISPRAPAEFQFVLRVEGVLEKKTAAVYFAFYDESSRETWKSYLTQGIESIAEDHKRKGITVINNDPAICLFGLSSNYHGIQRHLANKHRHMAPNRLNTPILIRGQQHTLIMCLFAPQIGTRPLPCLSIDFQ
jgi:hypothetical protein